jgi:hypothetical protein
LVDIGLTGPAIFKWLGEIEGEDVDWMLVAQNVVQW